jgi:hypothetical protein
MGSSMELDRVIASILLMIDANKRAAVSAAVGESGPSSCPSSCRLNRNKMVRPGLLLNDVFLFGREDSVFPYSCLPALPSP